MREKLYGLAPIGEAGGRATKGGDSQSSEAHKVMDEVQKWEIGTV
jgi:hypothetical protein